MSMIIITGVPRNSVHKRNDYKQRICENKIIVRLIYIYILPSRFWDPQEQFVAYRVVL